MSEPLAGGFHFISPKAFGLNIWSLGACPAALKAFCCSFSLLTLIDGAKKSPPKMTSLCLSHISLAVMAISCISSSPSLSCNFINILMKVSSSLAHFCILGEHSSQNIPGWRARPQGVPHCLRFHVADGTRTCVLGWRLFYELTLCRQYVVTSLPQEGFNHSRTLDIPDLLPDQWAELHPLQTLHRSLSAQRSLHSFSSIPTIESHEAFIKSLVPSDNKLQIFLIRLKMNISNEYRSMLLVVMVFFFFNNNLPIGTQPPRRSS